jgi:hypothetical protein
MSAPEKPNRVLHLDVSAPKGPELHLNAPGKQNHVLHLDLFAPKGPELHIDVSTCTSEACTAPDLSSVYSTGA